MKKFLIVFGFLLFAATSAMAQTANSLDQSANNSKGQYQPMNMGYAGFTSLGMTQAAWLDPLQNLGEGQTKPAYSKYYWHEDLVLPIRLREAMVTILNFPEWEMIESIQFGDANSFAGDIVGPSSVLLWTKGNIGVDTNVIIFGRSGNKYVFYLKSESVDTERLTNAIIDIEIPTDNGEITSGGGSSGGGFFSGSSGDKTQSATRRNQKKNWLKEIPFSVDSLRFDMEVYVPNPEDVVIAPERVWRDDIFTYIDLGEKSLTMTQRPIVTQIVERSEIPVGFRTKGPDNRLIIVEGIGDFVLRNGKRLICLKLRRSDSKGVNDYTSYEDDPKYGQEWDVPPTLPTFLQPQSQNAGNAPKASVNETYFGYGNNYMGVQNSKGGAGSSHGVQGYGNSGSVDGFGSQQDGYVGFNGSQGKNSNASSSAENLMAKGLLVENYSYNPSVIEDGINGNISVQLGTGDDISQMENLWSTLSVKYSDVLGGYEPFFSVDAPADGQGKELYHLRIGPINNLEKGDTICSQLGRKGVFCSVVRTQ